MKPLNFESENLVVDYISFKFQHLENYTQTEIANYLFKIGFNSYQESGKLVKPIKQSILVSSKNKFEVRFKIIQVFTSRDIEKTFLIKEFLDSYPSVLSNQRRTKMKRSLIELVGLLKQDNLINLIESNYKIISNGFLLDTEELTTHKTFFKKFVFFNKIEEKLQNW